MYYIGHGTTRVSTSDKTIFGFPTIRLSVRIGTCFGQGSTTPAMYLAICRRSIYRRLPDWQTTRYARIYIYYILNRWEQQKSSLLYIYILYRTRAICGGIFLRLFLFCDFRRRLFRSNRYLCATVWFFCPVAIGRRFKNTNRYSRSALYASVVRALSIHIHFDWF